MLNVKRKKYVKKTVIECVKVKDVKYIYWVKKDLFGCFKRGERDKDTETGLKEGGGIEMSTTVLPFVMLAPSLQILTHGNRWINLNI